jgi:hypothetical protein
LKAQFLMFEVIDHMEGVVRVTHLQDDSISSVQYALYV